MTPFARAAVDERQQPEEACRLVTSSTPKQKFFSELDQAMIDGQPLVTTRYRSPLIAIVTAVTLDDLDRLATQDDARRLQRWVTRALRRRREVTR